MISPARITLARSAILDGPLLKAARDMGSIDRSSPSRGVLAALVRAWDLVERAGLPGDPAWTCALSDEEIERLAEGVLEPRPVTKRFTLREAEDAHDRLFNPILSDDPRNWSTLDPEHPLIDLADVLASRDPRGEGVQLPGVPLAWARRCAMADLAVAGDVCSIYLHPRGRQRDPGILASSLGRLSLRLGLVGVLGLPDAPEPTIPWCMARIVAAGVLERAASAEQEIETRDALAAKGQHYDAPDPFKRLTEAEHDRSLLQALASG